VRARLATAAGGAAGWEVQLTRASQQPGARVEVVLRCYELDRLLAAAASGQIDTAVLAADLQGLDLSQLARLAGTGVAVIGVVPAGDDAAERRLRQLGFTTIVADTTPPDRLAELAQQEAATAATAAAAAGRELALREPGGKVLAVWGPKGAPGRTTIAVNLAYELARISDDLLLVDADTYGGAVAVTLGITDAPADLAHLAQLADRGTLDGLQLRALTQVGASGLRVATGLPSAAAWTAVRPATWEVLLGLCRQTFPLTVLDLAPYLDEDDDLAYDHVELRRNAVTRLTLQHADAVVAVARADPVGLYHFIAAYHELLELGVPAEAVHTVVNQIRTERFASEHQNEVQQVLDRSLGVRPAVYVPYDRRTLDQAASSTRAVVEVSGWSPVGRQINRLARLLTGIQPEEPRHRIRRWQDRTRRLLHGQVVPG
jgi:Flp pilus assembly CpaE family ATPase